MPLTYTNRLVNESGTEYPSLIDIAVGLSRQPRFAGQTRIWWSVLDHSLFCDELIARRTASYPRHWRLGVLLHDAHEALTSDVVSPFKNDALRALQRSLDVRIMEAFYPGGIELYDAWHSAVAEIDRRALHAEAQVIGAPVDRARIIALFGEAENTGQDVKTLEDLLWGGESYWAAPPLRHDQEKHPAVVEYLRRLLELL